MLAMAAVRRIPRLQLQGDRERGLLPRLHRSPEHDGVEHTWAHRLLTPRIRLYRLLFGYDPFRGKRVAGPIQMEGHYQAMIVEMINL